MNKAQTYPTHVHWDERDKCFVALAPDLPGCSAFGDTREEALRELEPVIAAWIENAVAAGEPVPEPSPLPKPSSYSGKVLLRMPASLHEKAVKDAASEGVSLNHWLVTLITAGAVFREYKAAASLQQEVWSNPKHERQLWSAWTHHVAPSHGVVAPSQGVTVVWSFTEGLDLVRTRQPWSSQMIGDAFLIEDHRVDSAGKIIALKLDA